MIARFRPSLRFWHSLTLLALLAVAAIPLPARESGVQPQSHTPVPSSVTAVGSFQSEATVLGCGDWDQTCAGTHLTWDAADQVWQGAFSLPAGTFEYKAAIDDSWSENYGAAATQGGSNIPFTLNDPATVKFYYSHTTHWITSDANGPIVVAVGDFQDDLGCAATWDPTCLRTWLQDPDEDGTYTFVTTALAAGVYAAKVAIDESWAENYGANGVQNGSNIDFLVPFDGAEMLFSYDGQTHVLTITKRQGQADGAISMADLRHDSRDTAYRTPGGAVTTGTAVKVRLRALGGDLTSARVRLWNDRTRVETYVDMTVAANDGLYDWWEATLPTGTDPTILRYRFLVRDGAGVAYYEDFDQDGGVGDALSASADRSWQLTSYDDAFTTPDWVKNGIVYQIFPDRFRNGNTSNDTPAGSFFYDEAGGTILRSAQGAWNRSVCDPRVVSQPCTNKYGSNFYGGDLQGIIDELPYLQDLGVTVLYLNPIFESPSNHRYDTSDYGLVDDNLGTLATFKTLTDAAHVAGMKVVLDGAFNHTSSDSRYFDRYHRFGDQGACESALSLFRDWYHFFPAYPAGQGVCAGDTTYQSWFGYDSLPKLDSTVSGTRQLVWDSPSSAARYWLAPARGADGWRLDVPGDIDPGLTNDPLNLYWEGFRAAVRTEKPDAWIVGEEWGLATAWTLGSEWDSAMNYQFSSAVLGFWRDEPFTDNDHASGSSAGLLTPLTPSQLDARLHNLEERYPRPALLAMMNLLGSHDTNRALFMLDHRTDENDAALYAQETYDWSDAISRLKGAAFLQMTLPGAPTIYYGDEIGLVGPVAGVYGTWQDDPYNRQPYPWLDESGTPWYTHLQAGGARGALFAHYKRLTAARNGHAALRTGSFDTLLVDDTSDVYAFGRRIADLSDAAVVVVNRKNTMQTIAVSVAGYLPEGAAFTDAMQDASPTYLVSSGVLTLSNVPAFGGAILVPAASLAAPPAEVSDLSATAASSSSVSLAWTAAQNANEYDVYESLVSGGGYTKAATTLTPGYTVTGLTPGTTYYFVVVSRNASSQLTSAHSNEDSATPQHNLGTATYSLFWPSSITHTVSTVNRTENIYARIYIAGATEAPGAAPGIVAQVGFAPDGVAFGEAWSWSDMVFGNQQGNDDEYIGTLLPDTPGTYDFAVRFSADGGATWFYADLSGPAGGAPGNPGSMQVLASADTTPPATPLGLALSSTAPTLIALTWPAVADGDVAGYEVYRKELAAPAYTRIASVGSAPSPAYTDYAVAAGVTYRYLVKAYDTSFNRSGASNTVDATAAYRYVDITFNVTVPSFTPATGSVYITGGIPELGSFNPGAVAMTKVSGTQHTYTLHVLDQTSFDYKFTRGSWETVEKMADGTGELTRSMNASYDSGATQTVNVTVANWRDPIVVSHSPGAGAAGVSPSATISITWSQEMPGTNDFAVSSPGGPVAGTFVYQPGSFTTTFTPAGPLAQGTTHTVTVAGKQDAGLDTQQVPVSWTFTTACTVQAPAITAEGPVAFCEGGSVTLTSSSASGNQWFRDGFALPGETGQSLVATTAGRYTVTATSGNCTSAASPATVVTVNPKPDATITVASPINSGATAGASVNVSCSGASFAWSITGGAITAGNGTPRVTFTAGAAGTLTLTVTVTTAAGCADTKSANVSVQLAPFGAPSSFRATASGTSANLQWGAVAEANHYEVWRSTDNVNWTNLGSAGSTTFADAGLTPSAAYLYRVRAVKADATLSPFSVIDFATTLAFTNDPVSACPVIVRAAHVVELRNAINAVRARLGLAPATFTDPSLAPGVQVRALHLTDLRDALAPALAAVGITPAYTDPTITPHVTTIKAAHVNELRDLLR